MIAEDIDLSRCDIKDSLMKDCRFVRCKINSASHAETAYVRSVFEECDFKDAALTNCEFREVLFVRCHLSNLLTKGCRLYDCAFVDCITETHVFESNVFLRCDFTRCELELRTIASNFGLKAQLMTDCRLRDGRLTEPHQFVEFATLDSNTFGNRDNPLASLSVRYFLDGNLLGGNREVDHVFDVKNWIQFARQPASLTQLVEQLTEFLINTYENDEVNVHKILLLHDITRQIVSDRGGEAATHRASISFGGIHLALSRFVEEYLATLQEVTRNSPQSIHLLADGPLSRSFFEEHLREFLVHCDVVVSDVRPHNSPVELILSEIGPNGRFYALALLLASFVRFELRAAPAAKVRIGHSRKKNKQRSKSSSVPAVPEFFEITCGLSSDEQRAYELRIKSILPTTSIVVDLRLAVSTRLIRNLREVIIRLLK